MMSQGSYWVFGKNKVKAHPTGSPKPTPQSKGRIDVFLSDEMERGREKGGPSEAPDSRFQDSAEIFLPSPPPPPTTRCWGVEPRALAAC